MTKESLHNPTAEPSISNATLDHIRGRLTQALFSEPEIIFPGSDGYQANFQALFDSLALPHLRLTSVDNHGVTLPRIIDIECLQRPVFDYLSRLLVDRQQPDRLFDALVRNGFRAANIHYGQEQVFVLLRPGEQSTASIGKRNDVLRELLAPLFQGRRTRLPRVIVDEFLALIASSPRLQARTQRLFWIENNNGELILDPHNDHADCSSSDSMEAYLLAHDHRQASEIRAVLCRIFALKTVRIPRELVEVILAMGFRSLRLATALGHYSQRTDASNGDLELLPQGDVKGDTRN